MNLLSRFGKAEKLVLDTCNGNLVTEKACLTLPEHRRLLGCEEDCLISGCASIAVNGKREAGFESKFRHNWTPGSG